VTAFYDFFRKIKLQSPPGETLETVEADAVLDTLTLQTSNGITVRDIDLSTDTFGLDVDYKLYVPIGSTKVRLQDVRSDFQDITFKAGNGITIVREDSDELTINSFSVAESDTLHTVARRGRITDQNLIANGISVGSVDSLAGVDGMSASDSEFIGEGTLNDPLRLDPTLAQVTTDPYSEVFEFTTENSDGILMYSIAISPNGTVSSYTFDLEREDPNNPGTYTTIESETGSNSDEVIFANNQFSESFDGSVNWRVSIQISGFTDPVDIQATFKYEVLDVAEDPVLETDNALAKIITRNIEPALDNQFDLGSSSLSFRNFYIKGEITGDLIPSQDITYDLGSVSNRWNDLYLSGNTIDLADATIKVVSDEFEFRDSLGNITKLSLGANDTDDLSEGSSNVYYTDTRVDSHLSGGTGVSYSSGEISIGQAVSTTDNVTFSTVTADLTGDVTGKVSDISNHDTDDLSEGTSNLYYTDTRARGAVSAGGDLSYTSSTGEFSFTERTDSEVRGLLSAGGDLTYTSSTGEFSVTTYKSGDFDTDFGNKSTDNLSEGTSNLYYTDTRARGSISATGDISYNSGTGEISFNNNSGYLTSESDTLDSVTGRGNSTSNAITVGGLTSEGLSTFQQTTELLNTKTGASGTVVHDFSTGAIWYHSSISADFTANFTNVPTTADRAISVVLVLDQGATGYLSNAVEINGVSQTINWVDATVPSGTANQTDVVSFSLIRQNSNWLILGSLNTFG